MIYDSKYFDLWEIAELVPDDDHPTWDESFLHEVEIDLVTENLKPWDNPFLMEFQQIEPSYLPDSDGNCLLYSGSRHLIIGKTQTLKSWILVDQIGKCNLYYFDFLKLPEDEKIKLNPQLNQD